MPSYICHSLWGQYKGLLAIYFLGIQIASSVYVFCISGYALPLFCMALELSVFIVFQTIAVRFKYLTLQGLRAEEVVLSNMFTYCSRQESIIILKNYENKL